MTQPLETNTRRVIIKHEEEIIGHGTYNEETQELTPDPECNGRVMLVLLGAKPADVMRSTVAIRIDGSGSVGNGPPHLPTEIIPDPPRMHTRGALGGLFKRGMTQSIMEVEAMFDKFSPNGPAPKFKPPKARQKFPRPPKNLRKGKR